MLNVVGEYVYVKPTMRVSHT